MTNEHWKFRLSPNQEAQRTSLVHSLEGLLGESLSGSANELVLSTSEVALLFRVSAATVRRWADTGALEAQRSLGGHRMFPISGVRRALATMGSRNDSRAGT